jgi:hypothetical protein
VFARTIASNVKGKAIARSSGCIILFLRGLIYRGAQVSNEDHTHAHTRLSEYERNNVVSAYMEQFIRQSRHLLRHTKHESEALRGNYFDLFAVSNIEEVRHTQTRASNNTAAT